MKKFLLLIIASIIFSCNNTDSTNKTSIKTSNIISNIFQDKVIEEISNIYQISPNYLKIIKTGNSCKLIYLNSKDLNAYKEYYKILEFDPVNKNITIIKDETILDKNDLDFVGIESINQFLAVGGNEKCIDDYKKYLFDEIKENFSSEQLIILRKGKKASITLKNKKFSSDNKSSIKTLQKIISVDLSTCVKINDTFREIIDEDKSINDELPQIAIQTAPPSNYIKPISTPTPIKTQLNVLPSILPTIIPTEIPPVIKQNLLPKSLSDGEYSLEINGNIEKNDLIKNIEIIIPPIEKKPDNTEEKPLFYIVRFTFFTESTKLDEINVEYKKNKPNILKESETISERGSIFNNNTFEFKINKADANFEGAFEFSIKKINDSFTYYLKDGTIRFKKL